MLHRLFFTRSVQKLAILLSLTAARKNSKHNIYIVCLPYTEWHRAHQSENTSEGSTPSLPARTLPPGTKPVLPFPGPGAVSHSWNGMSAQKHHSLEAHWHAETSPGQQATLPPASVSEQGRHPYPRNTAHLQYSSWLLHIRSGRLSHHDAPPPVDTALRSHPRTQAVLPRSMRCAGSSAKSARSWAAESAIPPPVQAKESQLQGSMVPCSFAYSIESISMFLLAYNAYLPCLRASYPQISCDLNYPTSDN